MCSPEGTHRHSGSGSSSPTAFLANLRQPGPLGWKLQRFFANSAYKIIHRQSCCGNGGEPGC